MVGGVGHVGGGLGVGPGPAMVILRAHALADRSWRLFFDALEGWVVYDSLCVLVDLKQEGPVEFIAVPQRVRRRLGRWRRRFGGLVDGGRRASAAAAAAAAASAAATPATATPHLAAATVVPRRHARLRWHGGEHTRGTATKGLEPGHGHQGYVGAGSAALGLNTPHGTARLIKALPAEARHGFAIKLE